MTVEHMPGRCNELPDVLSRNPEAKVFVEDTSTLERLLSPEAAQPREDIIAARILVDEVQEAQVAAELLGSGELTRDLVRRDEATFQAD